MNDCAPAIPCAYCLAATFPRISSSSPAIAIAADLAVARSASPAAVLAAVVSDPGARLAAVGAGREGTDAGTAAGTFSGSAGTGSAGTGSADAEAGAFSCGGATASVVADVVPRSWMRPPRYATAAINP